jgi:hypothetical protein
MMPRDPFWREIVEALIALPIVFAGIVGVAWLFGAL